MDGTLLTSAGVFSCAVRRCAVRPAHEVTTSSAFPQDEDIASVSLGAQRALPSEVEALAGGFTDSALSLSDSAGLGWWRYQGLRL